MDARKDSSLSSHNRSVAEPAAPARRPRRPTRAGLSRAKVATAFVSLVAFAGSFAGIAAYNPGVKAHAVATPPVSTVAAANSAPATGSTGDQFNVSSQDNSAPIYVPPPPRMPALRPFARSRGS